MSFEARIDLLATEDILADFVLAFERGTWPKSWVPPDVKPLP